MVNQAYLDKRKYGERVYDLLDNYDNALVVHCDNVGSRQFMDIRTALRPNSVVLMGKNTLMRKIIGNYCQEKGMMPKGSCGEHTFLLPIGSLCPKEHLCP